ncbi:hypothetical protein D3C76_1570930 [compost metagenome]
MFGKPCGGQRIVQIHPAEGLLASGGFDGCPQAAVDHINLEDLAVFLQLVQIGDNLLHFRVGCGQRAPDQRRHSAILRILCKLTHQLVSHHAGGA